MSLGENANVTVVKNTIILNLYSPLNGTYRQVVVLRPFWEKMIEFLATKSMRAVSFDVLQQLQHLGNWQAMLMHLDKDDDVIVVRNRILEIAVEEDIAQVVANAGQISVDAMPNATTTCKAWYSESWPDIRKEYNL